MRSLEKRQYEIEQGLRDPSELLGSKDSKGADEDGEGEESETSKAAKAEVITKAAMAAASKLLKSSDAVEKMKGTAMMTAAKLGFAVPRAEPGEEGSASKKANTPQEALKEATVIAMKYHHPDGKVNGRWCLLIYIFIIFCHFFVYIFSFFLVFFAHDMLNFFLAMLRRLFERRA